MARSCGNVINYGGGSRLQLITFPRLYSGIKSLFGIGKEVNIILGASSVIIYIDLVLVVNTNQPQTCEPQTSAPSSLYIPLLHIDFRLL